MDFKSMTKQEWQEHISVLRSYARKLQEPKDYGEKAGIAAYLFADAMANDRFPRYANKPYKDQINTLTTVLYMLEEEGYEISEEKVVCIRKKIERKYDEDEWDDDDIDTDGESEEEDWI